MTRLVLQMGVSIDGFATSDDGSQPWLGDPEDEAAQRSKLEMVRGADAHLMGRVTYLEMASHWPGSDSDYAAPMNEIPKVVFSKTLERADWPESRIAAGDLVEEVNQIRAQPGAGYVIAYGGAGLARSLIREALVDEYRLNVHPYALGSGKPIFTELPGTISLELIESHKYAAGNVAQVYIPRESQS